MHQLHQFIMFIIGVTLLQEVTQSLTVFLNQRQYIRSGIDVKYFGVILTLMSIMSLISAKAYNVSKILGQRRAISLLSIIIVIMAGILLVITSPVLSILDIGIITGANALMAPMVMDIENKSIKAW